MPALAVTGIQIIMEVGDRLCNLECVSKAPQVHEFVGPVKIILVEPPKKQYCLRTWFAAFLSFANVLLTVNFMLIFFHTVAFKTKFEMTGHIYLCTLGIQYFMFSGVLLINGLFGPATPMKKIHRNLQHLVVQILALSTAAAGTYIVHSRSKSTLLSTAHSIAGVASLVLAGVTAVTGPTTLLFKEGVLGTIVRAVHNFIGTLAVLTSSICFILGLIKPNFKKHMPLDDLYIFMIVFCVIYTLIVMFSPSMKNTDAKVT